MNIGAIGVFIQKNETLVHFFQSFNPFFLVLCKFLGFLDKFGDLSQSNFI